MRTAVKMSGAVNEPTIRPRYAETDAMGIVHHSQYVIWFEVGRSTLMREAGFSYAEIERAGFHFRIAEVYARYLAPAFYDELLTLRTWIGELHSRGLTFEYAVVRPADPMADRPEETLVTGATKLICTDRQGRVRRLPADFRSLLQLLAGVSD